jgi:hypothetical protein
MTAPDLALRDLLLPHRSEALDRWRGLVLDSYPVEAARFFRAEKDSFKNPVGQSIHTATETLLDGVLLEGGGDGIPEALEGLVRIRAVQDFSPSEAVAFVFLLKRAVREVLAEASEGEPPAAVLRDLETRVDGLALSAFETYSRCREELFEIRLRATQRRVAVMLERYDRAGLEGGAEHTEDEADHREKEGEA